MSERKKILWLCSWYPGEVEPFNGDFIQRHAQAAALYDDVHVIHVYGDATGKIGKTRDETTRHGHLTEQRIYFRKSPRYPGKLWGAYKWLFLFRRAIRRYIKEHGKPDLVHVHVPMKAGVFGVWMKRRYGIPYIVSEHWGIYNEIAPHPFSKRSQTFKTYTRQFFEYAAKAVSPSRFLANGVDELVIRKNWSIIPNVVNTGIFHRMGGIKNAPFRLIHVSNMVPLKNAPGILQALRLLKEKKEDVELMMVGSEDVTLWEMAIQLGIEKNVEFKGEVSYHQVAELMSSCHALVIFSDIENSPCVIGEALCCGLPVIGTNTGGIPELIDDSNGMLVEPRDADQLAAALQEMIREYDRYDKAKIAADAKAKFSYPVIGSQFHELYRTISLNSSAS